MEGWGESESRRWHGDIVTHILLAVFSLNIAYTQAACHGIVSLFPAVSVCPSAAAASVHACFVF